jgi:hypothetical protein
MNFSAFPSAYLQDYLVDIICVSFTCSVKFIGGLRKFDYLVLVLAQLSFVILTGISRAQTVHLGSNPGCAIFKLHWLLASYLASTHLLKWGKYY